MKQPDLIPSEFSEQVAFVQWLDLMGLKYTSVPNSTFTKSWKQKNTNKLSGLHAGFPDLIVIIPNKGLLCVELKRRKRGVISEAQKEWILALNTVPGVEARVCRGSDEAIAFVGEFYHKGELIPHTAPNKNIVEDVF